MALRFCIFLLVIFFSLNPLYAQHEHHNPEKNKEKMTKEKPKDTMQGMEHQQHQGMKMPGMGDIANPASEFLMNEGAGTGVNPASSPMSMHMKKQGSWDLMYHGYVFLNGIQQTGPRGDDRLFSTNHLMLMGQRDLNENSTFLLRIMLSLEPATVTDRRYPLLFQTGETAFGRPIVDGQHPHDLFMEISAQYAVQLNMDTLVHFYAGLIGDPALGPVAYPLLRTLSLQGSSTNGQGLN
jgi:hypothetical protein